MSAETDEMKPIILAFAGQLETGRALSPEAAATERGWLDDQGAVTQAGRDLVHSLEGQDGTRSVFRQY